MDERFCWSKYQDARAIADSSSPTMISLHAQVSCCFAPTKRLPCKERHAGRSTIGMELARTVTGAPAAAASGPYEKLGDAGNDEEAAPLIHSESEAEQIRNEAREEVYQVTRTVFVPTFCAIGFLAGSLPHPDATSTASSSASPCPPVTSAHPHPSRLTSLG